MSNQFDVAKVFEAISEAKDAYEALPKLRQRIDELEISADARERKYDELLNQFNEQSKAKNELEAKLKATTEERDEYSFRNLELTEKVEATAKLLGLVVPTAVPTVEPKPEEVPPFPAASTTTTTTAEVPINAIEPVGQSDTRPTSATEVPGAEPTGADSTTTTNGAGHGDSRPLSQATSQSGSDPNTASNQDGATAYGSTASASPASTPDNVHTMSPTHPASSTTEQRHKGKPSWMKPIGMSWAEWSSEGGYIPDWVRVSKLG